MEETDKILFDFMHENRHEIKDNGFSKKVAKTAIPQGAKKFSIIWNVICITGSVAILTVVSYNYDKFHWLKDIIYQFWQTMTSFFPLSLSSSISQSENLISIYCMIAFMIGIWAIIIIGTRRVLQK
ncbi:MAG: DUF5056 domain-containing protein [Bacteroidales bacterium]|nr:DUF5056 domain-containing protein [Bacteroidales bacterium]